MPSKMRGDKIPKENIIFASKPAKYYNAFALQAQLHLETAQRKGVVLFQFHHLSETELEC